MSASMPWSFPGQQSSRTPRQSQRAGHRCRDARTACRRHRNRHPGGVVYRSPVGPRRLRDHRGRRHRRMSDTPLLRLDEVSRIYGEEVKVHALDGVSLDIEVGEFVSIVGPSGSGKSTMLGLLGLLDLPSLGTLSVDGTSVADLSDHDRSTLRARSSVSSSSSSISSPTSTLGAMSRRRCSTARCRRGNASVEQWMRSRSSASPSARASTGPDVGRRAATLRDCPGNRHGAEAAAGR